MAEEMKACPFCGDADPEISFEVLYWRVACTSGSDCGIGGPRRDTEAEAIAAWNTRPTPEATIATPVSADVREALIKCRDQFRFYEREHQAKADNDTRTLEWRKANSMFEEENSATERDRAERQAKADTNRALADMCDAALTPAPVVEGKLTLVWASQGEYSDRSEWPIKVFADRHAAERWVVHASALEREARTRYRALSYDKSLTDPAVVAWQEFTGGTSLSDETTYTAADIESDLTILSHSEGVAERAIRQQGAE